MLRRLSRTMATIAALSALVLVSQAGAADKLVVKGTDGTTDVFKVEDTGVTTLINKTGVNANTMFLIKDIAGQDSLNYRGDGFLNIGGEGIGQTTISAFVGAAGNASNLPNARPNFEAYRLRGTKAAPAAVMPNDKLGTFGFAGYDGSGNTTTGKISGALLEVFVDGPVSTGSVPQRMSIITGSSFSARAERLQVKSNGVIVFKGGTAASLPTCDSSLRGGFWFTQDDTNGDVLQVCQNVGAGTYAWRKVTTTP